MEYKDQEFVEMVVKAIVDNPDKVKTERKVDEMGVLIELTVDPEDMGKIIGKEGKTAKSIRTLLRVLGAKERARVNMKIIEPETGRALKEPSSDMPDADTKAPDEIEAVEEEKEMKPIEDKLTEQMKPIEEKSTEVI